MSSRARRRRQRIAVAATLGLLVGPTACGSSDDASRMGITMLDGRPQIAVVACDATIDLLLFVKTDDDKRIDQLLDTRVATAAAVLRAAEGLPTIRVATRTTDHRRIRTFDLPIRVPEIDARSDARTGWVSVVVKHGSGFLTRWRSVGGGLVPGGPYPAYPIASQANGSDATFNLESASNRACD